ncbi:MAG: Gfo/Idh/MocA family oxidoreductase [Psychromonas sp.]
MKYIIVGSGSISKTWLKVVKKLNGQVVGFVSRSGHSVIEQLPVWNSLESVDAFFDAVIVTTPNGLHHNSIIAAAKLGKHVITEKPLEISLTSVDRCIDACKTAGVTLAVSYQRRTAPDNGAIKVLIEKGAFGRIFSADITAKFYRTQSYYDSADYRGGYAIDGGGVFMQQACHNLDLYTWFFGLPKQVVSMLDTFAHEMESEDHGVALFRHDNGMIGTIVASTATKPGFSAQLQVHTQKGSFTLTDDVITDWQIEGVANPTDSRYDNQHDGSTSPAVTDTRCHQAILVDFEDALKKEKQPIANASSARVTTELILKIYQSKI